VGGRIHEGRAACEGIPEGRGGMRGDTGGGRRGGGETASAPLPLGCVWVSLTRLVFAWQVATMWAAMKDTDYGKNPVFQKNFMDGWLPLLKATPEGKIIKVHIHIYIYIYIIYIYLFIYIYIHTYIEICTYTYIYIYIYVHVSICVSICMYIYIWTLHVEYVFPYS